MCTTFCLPLNHEGLSDVTITVVTSPSKADSVVSVTPRQDFQERSFSSRFARGTQLRPRVWLTNPLEEGCCSWITSCSPSNAWHSVLDILNSRLCYANARCACSVPYSFVKRSKLYVRGNFYEISRGLSTCWSRLWNQTFHSGQRSHSTRIEYCKFHAASSEG